MSDTLPEGIETITIHTTNEETLVLFRKSTKPPTPIVINVEDTNEFAWLRPLQESLASGAPVVIYTQNISKSGILGLTNCLRREPTGKKLSCFYISDEAAPEFDISADFYQQQFKKGLSINVFENGKWGTYRHLLLEQEPLVDREHCYVNVTTKGDLSSLRWIEGKLTTESVTEPEQNLLQVSVKF